MKLPIPEATLEQHVLALGKTRSGKSSAMRVLVEHLLNKEKPVCIIDPKGDWWGLKASADGKHAGYPVVIFGGEHGDVPINSRSGSPVAELIAAGNRSCIIDLGGWMPGARCEFLIDFLSTFFRTSRGRRWLVIDEVHNIAPQGKVLDPQSGKLLHWANRIASEGLGKGISLIAASQRPQKVHKDFVTSAETLIAMRVIHPLDRGAIKDWIDGCGDPEKGRDVLATLASNQRGQGWVWSPEIEFGPKRVQFPMFETFDSFKARTSEESLKLRGWADVDLADVRKKLESVVKEAEAKDPAKLQARVRQLEAELTKASLRKEGFLQPVADSKGIERAIRPYRHLLEEAMKLSVKITALRFDDAAIKPEEITKAMEAMSREISRITKVQISKRSEEFERVQREARSLLSKLKEMIKIEPLKVDVEIRHNQPAIPVQVPVPAHRNHSASTSQQGSNGKLPVGELAVLKAAAQDSQGVERKKITLLTGYKRSSRDAYVSRLTAKGLVEINGQTVKATEEGIYALGSDYEPLPSEGLPLREYWLAKLPEGERKVLEVLIAAGGQGVPRETIDEQTGYKRSSRDAYLSRLAARRVIESVGRGEVKASASLF